MTDIRIRVLKQLEPVADQPAVTGMRRWLTCEATHPLTEKPHVVSVADALDLWRVRVEISSSKGHALEGGVELLQVLTSMNARVKLQQVSFADSQKSGNVFFRKRDGHYVGSVLF